MIFLFNDLINRAIVSSVLIVVEAVADNEFVAYVHSDVIYFIVEFECGFAKNGLWWILIVVAAAICIVILVIILFVKKKKNDAPPPATPAPGGPAGSDNLSDARENEEDTDDPKKE